MGKSTNIFDKKSLSVVLGVIFGVLVVFTISSNFTSTSEITGYAIDDPIGIDEGPNNFSNNIIIYSIVGIFVSILVFYLLRRIKHNF